MKPDLKFFQEVGRDFLAARTRALLADQMRLGKTPQAITACEAVGAKRILVVCPAIARTVWAHHFKLWSGRQKLLTSNSSSHIGAAANELVMIVSYDQVRKNPGPLAMRRWDVLICDESHFLKSAGAQRTRAIFAKGGLGWYADRIWCLTGTPAPNHAGELWPMLRAFGAVKVGYWAFLNHFCRLNADGKVLGTKTERAVELRAILEKFTLRRLKNQVAPELPECTLESFPVESSTDYLDLIRPIEYPKMVEAARAQERQLKEALDKLPPEQHAEYLATHSEDYTTLRRINAILKTPAVFETAKFELENGLVDKLVIYAYHKEPIKLLREFLSGAGLKTEIIYGGTPQKKRDAALKAFARPTKRGGARAIICQILAAGVSIDLSAAHEGIALEEDWVPGNNAQAFERMGGLNQTQPISIRKAIIPGSIDSNIEAVLTRKEHELSEVFDK